MKQSRLIGLIGSILLAAICSSSSFAGQPQEALSLVLPAGKIWVTQGNVLLSGTVADPAVAEVVVRGGKSKKQTVPVTMGALSVLVSLKGGLNAITLTAGPASKTVEIYYQEKENGKRPPQGFVRLFLHANRTSFECKDCHRAKKGVFNYKRLKPAKADCTTGGCHSDMGKAEHVHGPVGGGTCIFCHNPHGTDKPAHVAREGKDLCIICHQDKNEVFDKKVVHGALEDGCIGCHDPHQSPRRFQLRGNAGPVSSLCFSCHEQQMFDKSHQHSPVASGDCIACHRPHSSDQSKLLIASPDKGKLCFECHNERKDDFTMKFVHDPVAEDCGNCHDPHSSENNFQLQEAMPQLCKTCHEDLHEQVYTDIADAAYKHPPVDEGRCQDCHRVHSSEFQPLLHNQIEKLCLTCHIDLADHIAESDFKHGPVTSGECTACHKVHGSAHSKLLARFFPPNFYSDYQSTNYDLCFGCHNEHIARKKFTNTLTNFRDGDYNLHYFHVNRKKGRTCVACHNPHSSSQAKHIREEMPFGAWSYPIEITKTDTGGTCVVGCHAPKTYDRKKPLLNVKKNK